MGTWPGIVRKLSSGLMAALVGVAFAIPRSGAEAYLPRSGPAPLRFASAPTQAKAFPWPPLWQEASAHTNGVPAPPSVPGVANPVPVLSGATNWMDNPALLDPLPLPTETNSAPVPTAPATSASEMLIVTPQMLAEYLKPALSGALNAATNAPPSGDVGFTPPTPKPSSEAIYRSQ